MIGQAGRGRFVTIEGIEGVGKSSNMAFVAELLRTAGKTVVVTREPGGTPLAEQIRALLLDHAHQELSSQAELLLMFAARAQHLAEKILPALNRGHWVVCDRFTDATRAYQGYGRGLPLAQIEALAALVHPGLEPDLTLLLDAPVDIALARVGRRGPVDRFEREEQSFFVKVAEGYRHIAREAKHRVVRIDATQPLADVQAQIREAVERFMAR